MIVWLASYPRSGNTLLRAILHRCFGLTSYNLYNNPIEQGFRHDVVGERYCPGVELVERSCARVFWEHNGESMRRLGYDRDGVVAPAADAGSRRPVPRSVEAG